MNSNLYEKLRLIELILGTVAEALKKILDSFQITIDLTNKDLKDDI